MPKPCLPFDYGDVPADTAAVLRAQASRIRTMVRSTTETIIQVGNDLIAVKQTIGHGKFRDWIEAECGFSVRSAENYIKAAEFAEGKSATVAFLQPATVYRLAAKSTPAVLVQNVMRRAESGEVVSDVDVAAAVRIAKREKRDVLRRQKPKPLSKGQISRREKQKREWEEQVRQRSAAAYEAALSIVAELGTEKARFVLRQYRSQEFDFFEMFSELEKQVGIGDTSFCIGAVPSR
jgi:hypothetical protein